MVKVYISSTYRDLKAEREAAAQAVRLLECHAVAMEDYTAADARPLEECLHDVRSCDVYVGLFAWRYGFVPPGHTKSITQLEYEAAREAGKPCLVFMLHEDVRWEPSFIDDDRTRIRALRDALALDRMVAFFRTIDELGQHVTAALVPVLRKFDRNDATREATEDRPEMPSHVLYHADRTPQRGELLQGYHLLQAHRSRRPMVCIVHGDVLQSHDAFLESLTSDFFPTHCCLDVSICEVPVVWAADPVPAARRMETLRLNLAMELGCPATPAAVAAALDAVDRPVLIETHLYSKTWQDDETELIASWLDAWNELPDLRSDHPVFVFLLIHYESTAGASWWARRKIERRHTEIRDFVHALDFDRYEGLCGVTLTELGAVRREDVENWARKYGRRFFEEVDLLRRVRELFGEADSLPMETLLERLKGTLETCPPALQPATP